VRVSRPKFLDDALCITSESPIWERAVGLVELITVQRLDDSLNRQMGVGLDGMLARLLALDGIALIPEEGVHAKGTIRRRPDRWRKLSATGDAGSAGLPTCYWFECTSYL
jgi:hypothetical protein